MATGAQRQEGVGFPSPPPPLPPPPPPAPTNGNGNGNSEWRKYLDGLVSLCNDAADRCPAGSLVDPPPPGLLVREPPCPNERKGNPSAEAGKGAFERIPVSDSGVPTNGHRVPGGGGSEDPVLVLLDMNGTLLYRAKKPLRTPKSGGSDGRGGGCGAGTVAFVHGDPVPLEYYMRPGAAELVAAMVRHPRVRLAFYTSMRAVNALPAASFLMPKDCKSTGTAPEVYDRPFNARDTGGVNHWDTTRNLPLIWSTPDRVGTGFGAGNTVMVDDTPKKMRFMDAGLVVVPEYTKACVLAACGGEPGGRGEGGMVVGGAEGGGAREAAAREQAEVMPRLTEYMLRLLEQSGPDVRPFIECNPFQPKAPPDTRDENASTPSHSAAFSAAHADGAPTTSTGAAVLAGSKRSASSALEAAAGTPSPPAGVVEAVGQALPLTVTTLPDDGGGSNGGEAKGLEEAIATPVVAAATPAAATTTTAIAATAAAANAAEAGVAGSAHHGDTRVSLLDAVELVLTTGPFSYRRQAGMGVNVGVATGAGAEGKAGAAQESGGTGATTAARRAGLGFQGFGDNVEVSVATAVSELLKAASAAAERWGLPLGEQETLKTWSNAAATSVASGS